MSYYKHIKVHSSVKPFFCTLCNYRAVRKDNVRQHVKKVTKHWFSLLITKFNLSYPSNRFTKWPCPTPWSSSGRTAITTTAMSILIRMRSSTKTNNSRDAYSVILSFYLSARLCVSTPNLRRMVRDHATFLITFLCHDESLDITEFPPNRSSRRRPSWRRGPCR